MNNLKIVFGFLFIALYYCALLSRNHLQSGAAPPRKLAVENSTGKKITDPRKLFLSFSWNSREKRYVQRERMKEIMKNTVKNLMERYQFEAHLDQWNHETLEDIHRQYTKAKSNVQLAKHFLIEKMDNIYNNFVQPARWFY